MTDFDDDLITDAFAGFAAAAAPSVRATGTGAVRHTVKRRRARTTAALSVLGVLLLAAPALAYASLDRGSQGPPDPATSTQVAVSPSGAPSPSATPSPAVTPSIAHSPAKLVLGPLGYGDLRLGQNPAEALATGLVDANGKIDDSMTCDSSAVLTGTPAPEDEYDVDGKLFFSKRLGLAAIYAMPGVETPEGLRLGMTYDELIAIYPSWESVVEPDRPIGRGYVDVPGNPAARYRIEMGHTSVIQISLQLRNQDCYE
ncbi:hypothetical protein [Catellatospora coxensis]|uniref:Uncharacterized protein n=1 Tax=Catellatospora coxensis TaxID=310354 RepID=A0A8J3KN25_9ACTN|nr:hypothetical protein [Catellatospora coxensis]GIG05558.1 hypothetical protein Cco03nite_22580 [Catellatospora coxensis]